MNKKEAKKRIEQLRQTINRHRRLYHVLDRQEISDAALDSLKKELFELERRYPEFVTSDSPTQRVGGEPLKKFQKVAHRERMLSLNDAFSKQDMEDWLERILKLLSKEEKKKVDFYCELKIDGLAIELVYEHGVLKTGSTRGDGLVGEDVTQNLKTIEAIPLSLQTLQDLKSTMHNSNIVVRGEVFISKNDFEKINKEQNAKGLPPYANPRNIAAGSVRQLDPKVTASRRLDSFAYDIIEGVSASTHEEKHAVLKSLGFKTNPHNRLCKTLQEVFSFWSHAEGMRKTLEYEVDGVVVIVNNNSVFKTLGVAGKAPRGAIAFKFAQSQATTVIEDVKVQVGRTGAITPVAILKPVQVSGITITRATLHNEDEITRLGLKIGDTVVVARAGDVIPDIVKVLPELRTGKEKNFVMPKHCPSCKTKLEKSEAEALWRCPNAKCFVRQRRNFYHFVSRAAFNIEGLGPKIIDRLLDEGLVQDPSDIFELQEGDVLRVERFGEKSAENLIKSISKKRKISLPKFIYALGIRNVGEETAHDLAQRFGSIEKIKEAKQEDLEKVMDIGPVVARSIRQWFDDKDHLKFLHKLLLQVNIENDGFNAKPSTLSGKTFVLTGSLESMGRQEAKEKIRSLGGQVSESISKKTDFVVAGIEAGSKLEKAKRLHINIINEAEFLKILK